MNRIPLKRWNPTAPLAALHALLLAALLLPAFAIAAGPALSRQTPSAPVLSAAGKQRDGHSTALAAHDNCSDCHLNGTGSGTLATMPLAAEICATCHDPAGPGSPYQQWSHSGHGGERAAGASYNRAGTSCVPCHTTEGFFEVNVLEGHQATAPYDTIHGVTCQVCHGLHGSTGSHQLRIATDFNSSTVAGGTTYQSDGTVAKSCDVCHHLRPGTGQPGSRPHESHQTDLLNGTVGYRFPGQSYPAANQHNQITDRCIGCHMATPNSANRGLLVGGHTLNMRYAVAEGDTLSLTEACARCHSGIGADFNYHNVQDQVRDLLGQIKSKLPLYGPEAGARLMGQPRYSQQDVTAGLLTTVQLQAAYNWYVVGNDGSEGIHNPRLVLALLQTSLEALQAEEASACGRQCDLNSDGRSDVADVVTMLLQIRATPADSCLDRNHDGRANILDALDLLMEMRSGTLSCTGLAGTQLAGGIGLAPLERMPGLTAEDVAAVEALLARVELAPDEQAAFRLALHGPVAGPQLPRAFALEQNSPNPFNPSTTISYSVPEGYRGTVSLEVFDLRGRLVKVLAEGVRPAGSYTVFWDGRDRDGAAVASGSYLCRMRAGSFSQTRKLVLLK